MATIRGTELRGPALPIRKGRAGYWPRMNAKALRKSSIMMILGTLPGERVGQCNFGSLLPMKIFEPNDERVSAEVYSEVVGAITKWDPYVHIINVAQEQSGDTLTLFVDYIDLADQTQDPRRAVFTMNG